MDLKIIIGLVILGIAAFPFLKEMLAKNLPQQNPIQNLVDVIKAKEPDQVECFRKLTDLVGCLDPQKDAAEIEFLAKKIAPKLVRVR